MIASKWLSRFLRSFVKGGGKWFMPVIILLGNTLLSTVDIWAFRLAADAIPLLRMWSNISSSTFWVCNASQLDLRHTALLRFLRKGLSFAMVLCQHQKV